VLLCHAGPGEGSQQEPAAIVEIVRDAVILLVVCVKLDVRKEGVAVPDLDIFFCVAATGIAEPLAIDVDFQLVLR